jgi:hypothetical protein
VALLTAAGAGGSYPYWYAGRRQIEVLSASARLPLGGLRRKIEAALMPDDPIVGLRLDALAERERRWRRILAARPHVHLP